MQIKRGVGLFAALVIGVVVIAALMSLKGRRASGSAGARESASGSPGNEADLAVSSSQPQAGQVDNAHQPSTNLSGESKAQDHEAPQRERGIPPLNPREPRRDLARVRTEIVPSSRPLFVGHEQFSLVNAYAVETKDYYPSLGEAVETKGGFTIFSPRDPEAVFSMSSADGHRPVVVNQSNGSLGVVTGTVQVKLSDVREAQALGAELGLKPLVIDPSISVVYFRADRGVDLTSIENRLKRDPRVLRVTLEVFQSSKVVH